MLQKAKEGKKAKEEKYNTWHTGNSNKMWQAEVLLCFRLLLYFPVSRYSLFLLPSLPI